MMKHAALFTLISLALTCPVIAKPHHGHHDAARKSHHAHHYTTRKSRHGHDYAARKSHHDRYTERKSHRAEHDVARKSHDAHEYAAHASHSAITCEMVRAYVAKVGLGQAIALAKSAGISAADEQRARQCLANKI